MQDTLKLVDVLALDRTYLANERTLLAYLRSAFALFVAGVSFLKLFPHDLWLQGLGWGFLGLAPLLIVWGVYRSRKSSQHIHSYLAGKGGAP